MSADRVLVAFASQNGSTAGVAETLAVELRDAGFAVDCLPVAEVRDLAPYGAVVLGSGVFLAGRGIDGGGFIARHEAALALRPVWLFSAGPIGGPGSATTGARGPDAPVVRVARAIGARGAATFGASRLRDDDGGDRMTPAAWSEAARVRGWAWSIAVELVRLGIGAGSITAEPPRPLFRPAAFGRRPIVVTR
jgi:menaquinone-dependent protoporphyrinogen oxidase